MYPAYSSLSSNRSWSQTNSSCCRTTENSSFTKSGKDVCERRDNAQKLEPTNTNWIMYFRVEWATPGIRKWSLRIYLRMHSKLDFIPFRQCIRNINDQAIFLQVQRLGTSRLTFTRNSDIISVHFNENNGELNLSNRK